MVSETADSAPQPVAGTDQSGADATGGPGEVHAGTAPSLVKTEPARSVDAAGTAAQSAQPSAQGAADSRVAAQRFPDPSKVNAIWWLLASLLLAAGVACSIVVAWGTAYSHGHRLAVAGAALLDVVALAMLAHVILLWYQAQISSGPSGDPGEETLDYRRRGLKAAVIGRDGRASTSKTQVVLWTGAVVWALIDFLLLARAYPSGNLFTGAVTSNWRPEYLVLLGLPVAAAVTAKAVVSASNKGQGPRTSAQLPAAPDQTTRVYVRDPVSPGVKGFVAGLAELISADNGTVAWGDLQYAVFTLITLVYFVVQVLANPQLGLPAVPAALLTLMGVSASGYAASKIVQTQGAVPAKAQPVLPE